MEGLEGRVGYLYPPRQSNGSLQPIRKQGTGTMTKHLQLNRRVEQEPKPRKTSGERRVRHRSRVGKLQRIPKVKEGRTLDDDRAWMDW